MSGLFQIHGIFTERDNVDRPKPAAGQRSESLRTPTYREPTSGEKLGGIRFSTKEQSMSKLKGKKIAILATDGVEAVELTEPKKALEKEGATVHVISLKMGQIKGFNHDEAGPSIKVDKVIESVKAEDYDNLILPGGVANPDKLRSHPEVAKFIKSFVDDGKVVAAICHGPWTLIEAGVVRGRVLTSWPSLKTDITNAGGTWVDKEVIFDKGLITSRKPDDLPAFNREIITEFSRGMPLRAAS
jgi:protease I